MTTPLVPHPGPAIKRHAPEKSGQHEGSDILVNFDWLDDIHRKILPVDRSESRPHSPRSKPTESK